MVFCELGCHDIFIIAFIIVVFLGQSDVE